MRAGLPALCEDDVPLGLSFIGFASAQRATNPRTMYASGSMLIGKGQFNLTCVNSRRHRLDPHAEHVLIQINRRPSGAQHDAGYGARSRTV